MNHLNSVQRLRRHNLKRKKQISERWNSNIQGEKNVASMGGNRAEHRHNTKDRSRVVVVTGKMHFKKDTTSVRQQSEVVLESPVQSGYLPFLAVTKTKTG